MEQKNKIAAIRIRGQVGIKLDIEKTMTLLNLHKKNYCAVVSGDKNIINMLQKAKDYITFGEITEETFLKLLEHRGRIAGNKLLIEQYLKEKLKTDFKQFVGDFFANKVKLKDIPGLKKFFRLHPPDGGFERMGVKQPYSVGGAAGYRGKEINRLIEKMI